MQNYSNSGTLCVLVHPNQTLMFSVVEIPVKVPKCTKTWDKSVQVCKFVVHFQYLKFSVNYMF